MQENSTPSPAAPNVEQDYQYYLRLRERIGCPVGEPPDLNPDNLYPKIIEHLQQELPITKGRDFSKREFSWWQRPGVKIFRLAEKVVARCFELFFFRQHEVNRLTLSLTRSVVALEARIRELEKTAPSQGRSPSN